MLGRLFFLPNIWNVTRIFLVDPFFFNPDRTPGGHIYYVSFFFFWDIYNLPVKFPEYVHHVSYVFLHNSHLSFFSALWNIPYIWPSRPRIWVSTMTTLYVISLLNLLVEVFFCFFFLKFQKAIWLLLLLLLCALEPPWVLIISIFKMMAFVFSSSILVHCSVSSDGSFTLAPRRETLQLPEDQVCSCKSLTWQQPQPWQKVMLSSPWARAACAN